MYKLLKLHWHFNNYFHQRVTNDPRQLAFGSERKSGPAKSRTQKRKETETSEVIMVLHPALSWTEDLESEAVIGRQEKKEPNKLETPCENKSLKPVARKYWTIIAFKF